MNRFLALVLLANLVFAHLPPTPASLRRSAAHKKRLDGKILPSAVNLHRRLPDDILKSGDEVQIFDQPSDGILSAKVNGVAITLPLPASGTPSPSESPTPTPSPSSSDTSSPPGSSPPSSEPSSSSEPSPSSGLSPSSEPSPSPEPSSSLEPSSSPSRTEPPPSPSDPAPTSSTPDPALPPPDLASSTSQGCGLLGIICPTSSNQTPSPTVVPPSSPTSDPPKTSDPPASQPPPSPTVVPPSPPTSDPPKTSDPPASQPPPTTDTVNSGPVSSQPSLVGSDSVATPGTTGDLCILFHIGCPTPSTSTGSGLSPTLLPPVSSNPTSTRSLPVTSDATPPPPPSATDDMCIHGLGTGCLPISTTSDPAPTRPPSTTGVSSPSDSSTSRTRVVLPDPPSSSTPTSAPTPPGSSASTSSTRVVLPDPLSSTPTLVPTPPGSSTFTSSTRVVLPDPPSSSTPTLVPTPPGSSTFTSSTRVVLPDPPSSSTPDYLSITSTPTLVPTPPGSSTSTSGVVLSSETPDVLSSPTPDYLPITSTPASVPTPSGSSTSITSMVIVLPTSSSHLPSSSIPNSLSITSTPTSAPTPTNTQYEWSESLSYSSISESVFDSLSLTGPDQAPTTTSFSATGIPNTVPSVAPLPSGLPARIVLGAGGVNPEVDDLDGFTLITILFDLGLPWDLVARNSSYPGLILSRLPVPIQTALDISTDQVKPFSLDVFIPGSYKGPPDASLLGTMFVGYVPTTLVATLAAQIKTPKSLFYTGQYSDLASHVDPSFDITTVTATAGIPGSGGSNNGSSGGAPDDSRIRENAIIGVVSALGGITLIVLGYLIYRAVQKRRELAHRRLSDPPTNTFTGEAPPNRDFDQDSIGGQRRRSYYFAEDSLRGFSDHNYTNDGARLSPEQVSGLDRRPITGSIGPPVMRENSLNF